MMFIETALRFLYPDNFPFPLNSLNEEDIIHSCILRLEAGELE